MDTRAVGFAEWAITYVRTIVKTCLGWFATILKVLDMEPLWIGAVVFVIVFSVILLPLRGGSMLGGGMVSDVSRHQLSIKRRDHKKNAKKHSED